MLERQYIPASALRIGQRVLVCPVRDGLPRGHKLNAIPMTGQIMTITDYLHGMAQRGAVHCYLHPSPVLTVQTIADIEEITKAPEGEE